LLAEGVLNGITTEALRVDFNANFARQSVLMPGAAEALTWCRSRGLRTGLVTNGRVAMQQEKVRALGLCALLDTVVISEAEGITKPHSSIFHRAVARLGGEPGAAVFVGDHPEADIAGARAAGLHAIWVQVPYWAPPTDMHAQVLCLTELPDVLLRLGAQTADVPAAW
jgi:putative hydrolase of the HAD superfamily